MRAITHAFICVLIFFNAPLEAAPKIHFTDYRVLLTSSESIKDYQIFNQGNRDAYCSTQVIDHNVSDSGKLSLAQKNNRPATSAANIIRVSPRRVLVSAMSNQKVKVVARKIRNLPKGEWVSYLSLRCKEHTPSLEKGVQVSPNFVFNIPVVVRNGELEVSASLSQPQLSKRNGKLFANIKLNRRGERSLYGNLVVFDDNGILAQQKGISHYLQSSTIQLALPLKQAPKGAVTFKFVEQKQFGGDLELIHVL